MTFRVRVEHRSRYSYANAVYSSFNEARITPLTTPWQLVLESQVSVQPASSVQAYVDYWGTVVHAFDLHQAHAELSVIGRSIVETSPGGPDEPDVGWTDLHDDRVRDQFIEFLTPTAQVPSDARLVEVAAELVDADAPGAAVEAAIGWVGDQLAYVPGTTGVHTSAIDAWEGAEGVCQDFAHLTLALLRAAGVPSRYCSGYLYPKGDAAIGAAVEGQSHAWVEAWTGDWTAFDPTSGTRAGEQHVLVARGRDYADVAPIKGIFHGGPTLRLDVAVNLTRLA